MDYLKSYTDYFRENIFINQLTTGLEVTYNRKDVTTQTKKIHRIDHDAELIYFLDANGKEFSKGLDEIAAI